MSHARTLIADTHSADCASTWPDPIEIYSMVVMRALQSAFFGAAIGAGGVVVSGLLGAGRMPPKQQIAGAAAFMGTVLGAGSMVRR